MKENKEIAPGTMYTDTIIDPETGEEKKVKVQRIAGIDLSPGDLDEIIEEIKKIMYEKVMEYPKSPSRRKRRKKSALQYCYEAIQEMYRKKHPRLVQYIDMLKDDERLDIHTATEEQISKIGESEETTPISLNYFTGKIREDFDQIVEEFRYRMNEEKLNRYKRKEMKRFEDRARER
jgi:hypothetical protein